MDGSVDNKGKGPETSIPSNEKKNIQSDAELRSSFVVVPPDDEAKPISCPICKERIKTEFSEDDKGWIWRNAILKDEKVRLYVRLMHVSHSDSCRRRSTMLHDMQKLSRRPIPWLRACVATSFLRVGVAHLR